ncbi:MAG: methyltransferase domain-containing protein [Gammaproteobacteria bacterium]|nr:methyltransferase domain-containing protein [Gammaproteobacteria bacterium]
MVDFQEARAQTESTRRRYDRIAPIYDALESGIELRARHWRRELWHLVGKAEKILELGVGTGKSFPFYPPGTEVTAIDISDKMLARARRRAERLGTNVTLRSTGIRAGLSRQLRIIRTCA